ncbi:MAG: hypothetical protein KDA65_03430 [Planctomycetaceae bacterium]|nr:hypothetical protein [Planctomycetaceae bacterium]
MSHRRHFSHTIKALLISGCTVIGVSLAAAFTSIFSEDRGIGITAWVAVAVVGSATMIATAKHILHSSPNSEDPEDTHSRSSRNETILISEG